MQDAITLFAEALPDGQVANIDIVALDLGVVGIVTPEDLFVDNDTASRCSEFANNVPGLTFVQHFEDAYSGLKSSAFISS